MQSKKLNKQAESCISPNFRYCNFGPLFFLIFYNDLTHVLNFAADAYADDTTMTVAGKTVDKIGARTTENCELLTNWMIEDKHTC